MRLTIFQVSNKMTYSLEERSKNDQINIVKLDKITYRLDECKTSSENKAQAEPSKNREGCSLPLCYNRGIEKWGGEIGIN